MLMQAEEYRKMAALEDSMWWYRALRANLFALLTRRRGAITRVLDAGCGTGGTLRFLAAMLPETDLIGVEFDATAAQIARDKAGRPVVNGSVNQLPFADGSFDVVISADVLCHGGVDEAGALAELHRCLKPGGLLLLNLPAYRWLLSPHDRVVHNVRRYSSGGLRRQLAAHGFSPIGTSYWNTLLFPLMVLRRKLSHADATSDVRPFPPLIERIFDLATGLETALLRRGGFLPFGGSLLVQAVRHG
jgi:SAM-dependent methyltransferase